LNSENAAPQPLEFQRLIPDSVGIAMRAADPADFLGWVRERLLGYAAPDSPLHRDTNLGRAMAFAWARAVWNGLPLNSVGVKPKPLPQPGRHDPCPCGSGDRFEECCLAVPPMPPLTQDVLWPYVLANLQRAERDDLLSSSRVPRGALIEFAALLLEQRRGAEVMTALEPRLAAPERYHDEDTAILLDLLCEAYGMSAQGAQRKLNLLHETTQRAPRSPLRSEAWQRLARIYMDGGDSERAWSAFRQAQHDSPHADELCVLEVELLIAGHRLDEAKQRARDWMVTLASHGMLPDDPRMEFLSRMAVNPLDQVATVRYKIEGAGGLLRDWLLQGAERRLPLYSLVPAPSPPRFVLAAPALAAVERGWREVFVLAKPFSTQDQPFGGADVWAPGTEAKWCGFLLTNPQSFDSLDILDDLATAVGRHAQAQSPALESLLLAPILERSAMLIERACRDAGAVVLPWSYAANRPALRALFRRFQQYVGRENSAAAMKVAETLLRLNPADEHGVRGSLEYLREGTQPQGAEK
jgi:tetratricopeptide (TPR) repeat protein